MKRQLRIKKGMALRYLGFLLASSLVLSPELLSAPPSGLDSEVVAAKGKVLANPFDSAARRALADLRARQLALRNQSLVDLAAGLEAYRQGRLPAAGPYLRKATRSVYVVRLANAILLRPLDEMAKQCAAAGGNGAAGPCTRCGGSGKADCTACNGSGFVQCNTCRGKGTARQTGGLSTTRSSGRCQTCRGYGSVPCQTCNGSGRVPCRCLARQGAPRAGQEPGRRETAAIEQVAAMARYLAAGGMDLYSPEALNSSPKTVLAGAAP